MVRSYSRHGPVEAFGTIATNLSNSLFDGKVAWVPANEDVIVWNMKKGEMLALWHEQGVTSQVTCIARSPNKSTFAVGHQDGSIHIWDSVSKAVLITFNGHRKAVTSLAFDSEGVRLASGSQDTDIILWDVSAEVGLFKLRGHRDQITSLAFVRITSPERLEEPQASTSDLTSAVPVFEQHLLSSSKDTLVKLWDCSTQHCVSTIVAHRGQVWSMATFVDPSTQRNIIITGGGEGEAKAWWIDPTVTAGVRSSTTSDTDTRALKSLVDGLLPLATLSHAHRIAQIAWHPEEQLLALQTTERAVEILRLRSEEELRKKVARRRKREREKKKDSGDTAGDLEESSFTESGWKDRLASWVVVRSSNKIRSFAFGVGSTNLKGEVNLMTALNSNALEVHQLPAKPKKSRDKTEDTPAKEAIKQYALELPGHRTDVRAMALSSDDELLATASHGQLKIWNVKTTKCLRTMDCGYAICMAFLPGDRHVIIGTKAGELLLYDIGSSTLLETFFAHTKTVWSLAVRPDGKGIVTGSEDKDIKFWDFEVKDVVINADEVDAPPATRKTLSMTHVKTLKMTEDVLAVKYSPNSSFLAVALLDMTVKIFYADTLKFFLSLYGHKLPVLSIDISSDSKLIITSSADKNVKIWGLDFGDCHRSLFAHDDSVMQVQFEKGTHYFWSVGKDRLVKYWDADKFQCIQKLEGHHGEVWALAVGNQGKFVATAAHDKSIRIWEKLDEPLFLEEERERELEAIHDANVERDRERDELRAVKEGEVLTEAVAVSKTTNESLTAGERIIEALEIAQEDRAAADAHELVQRTMTEEAKMKAAPRPRNAIFSIYSQDIEPEVHVLRVIQKISPAALNDAMLVLPFSQVTVMLQVLDYWASESMNIPLTSRILMFLLKTHASQIIATRAMRSTVLSIRAHLDIALSSQKDTIGYNMAALKHIKRQGVVQKTNDFYETAGFGEEAQVQSMLEDTVKKRKRVVVV